MPPGLRRNIRSREYPIAVPFILTIGMERLQSNTHAPAYSGSRSKAASGPHRACSSPSGQARLHEGPTLGEMKPPGSRLLSNATWSLFAGKRSSSGIPARRDGSCSRLSDLCPNRAERQVGERPGAPHHAGRTGGHRLDEAGRRGSRRRGRRRKPASPVSQPTWSDQPALRAVTTLAPPGAAPYCTSMSEKPALASQV